jgi:hypothetical protein
MAKRLRVVRRAIPDERAGKPLHPEPNPGNKMSAGNSGDVWLQISEGLVIRNGDDLIRFDDNDPLHGSAFLRLSVHDLPSGTDRTGPSFHREPQGDWPPRPRLRHRYPSPDRDRLQDPRYQAVSPDLDRASSLFPDRTLDRSPSVARLAGDNGTDEIWEST